MALREDSFAIPERKLSLLFAPKWIMLDQSPEPQWEVSAWWRPLSQKGGTSHHEIVCPVTWFTQHSWTPASAAQPGDPQLNSHKQITSLLFILVSWPLQWRLKNVFKPDIIYKTLCTKKEKDKCKQPVAMAITSTWHSWGICRSLMISCVHMSSSLASQIWFYNFYF